jgi:hypothetical protein
MICTSCSVTSDMLIPLKPRKKWPRWLTATANGPFLRIFFPVAKEPQTYREGSLLCEIYDNSQPFAVPRS